MFDESKVHTVQSVTHYNLPIPTNRMYGHMTPMYESGGTRMFKLGRTDTIRNTTDQAHTFIAAMQDPAATVSHMEVGAFSPFLEVVQWNLSNLEWLGPSRKRAFHTPEAGNVLLL